MTSVTRLVRLFESSLQQLCTKVAQLFGAFLAYFEKNNIHVNKMMLLLLGECLETFELLFIPTYGRR